MNTEIFEIFSVPNENGRFEGVMLKGAMQGRDFFPNIYKGTGEFFDIISVDVPHYEFPADAEKYVPDFDVEGENKLKALFFLPGAESLVVNIRKDLESLQQAVGGLIEVYYPFDDDVCVICNDEGKINGMMPNRGVYVDNELADVIFGPFLIVGEGEADFESLTSEQLEKYYNMFRRPEIIVDMKKNFKGIDGIGIAAIPYEA